MAKPSRRDLLKAGVVGAAGIVASSATSSIMPEQKPKFKLNFAPHFGMFQNHAGADLVDQLKFAADEGFAAWEDNGMKSRSITEQERIAKAMGQLGIQMGIFVVNPSTAWTPFLASGKQESVEAFLKECRESIEVAKRVNAKWMTFVPGTLDPRLDQGYQMANAIDGIRKGCEVLEPHGLVMVMEALNWRRDHPGMLLHLAADNYMICRAVNSPSLKILFDLYHQAVDDGNLINHMDMSWSEIAYIQTGDHPGRCEPGTGEVNYKNVCRFIASKGYRGILGMEHGKSKQGKEGERAVIEAYRTCDPV